MIRYSIDRDVGAAPQLELGADAVVEQQARAEQAIAELGGSGAVVAGSFGAVTPECDC